MNDTTTIIHAKKRDSKGKSAAKQLRADSFIPAVVYGHKFASLALSLNAAEINKLFKPGREDAEEYRLYKLLIDTEDDSQGTMVMLKEIQRHPINDSIHHIDFFAVRMDEKITAPVHLKIVGKSAGVKLGGILRHILREITVKSLPTDIPPHIDIDVSELQIGDSVHVRDLQLPANVQIITDLDAPIVSVLAPVIIKEEKEEVPSAEAAPAEGEQKEVKDTKESKDTKDSK